MANEEVPLQLNRTGVSSEFGTELECPGCDLVIYVKTGEYMGFTAGHICPAAEDSTLKSEHQKYWLEYWRSQMAKMGRTTRKTTTKRGAKEQLGKKA